jgi:hypothetical protein
LPQLKKALRDHQADIIRIADKGGPTRHKKSPLNIPLKMTEKLNIIGEYDYKTTYEMFRRIAQIEEKIGNEMITLFETFMKDLSIDRSKLRDLQVGRTRSD